MQKEASRQGISLGLFQYRMVLLQRTIDRGPLPVPVDPVWADGMRDFMKERVIEEAAESQLLVVQRCLKQPLVNLPIHEPELGFLHVSHYHLPAADVLNGTFIVGQAEGNGGNRLPRI